MAATPTHVRFGIIGYGNMGTAHASYFKGVPGATLTAICDSNPAKAAAAAAKYDVKPFTSHHELLASGTVDAIIIAVPHYDHMPIAMDAFAKGIHVLCEKPIAVSVKDARNGVAAYEAALTRYPNLKFGIMFQMRTSPLYKKLRDLIVAGELGEITRLTWIATNWFRTWTYYASGGWRATWKGEGGGVLINQCPHNLDMIQWVLGGLMPSKVTAVGYVGKTHPIEVEDDISAILEYPNGAVGHFITTTGEAPGTNRLEIAGDRGRFVAENGKLTFHRTLASVKETNQKSPEAFANVETWTIEVPVSSGYESHKVITDEFAQTILLNKPNESMLAPGPQGVRGLEIGNAILQASLTRNPVSLPVNGDAYDAFINEMHQKYGGRKTLEVKAATSDLAGSYQKV